MLRMVFGERLQIVSQPLWDRHEKEDNTMLSANISNYKRKVVYRRDGWRCALCDDTAGLQIHHIIPRSRGGSNSKMNLVTLCWKCHAIEPFAKKRTQNAEKKWNDSA